MDHSALPLSAGARAALACQRRGVPAALVTRAVAGFNAATTVVALRPDGSLGEVLAATTIEAGAIAELEAVALVATSSWPGLGGRTLAITVMTRAALDADAAAGRALESGPAHLLGALVAAAKPWSSSWAPIACTRWPTPRPWWPPDWQPSTSRAAR